MAGVPNPRTYTHMNSKYLLLKDFQPAQWTVVPVPAGTMCRHAGKIG
jgi:hypothetical protein